MVHRITARPTAAKTRTASAACRNSGLNYAQARYQLYWLQEQGLLQDFYRRFRASAHRDPTGRTALEAVLGEDVDAIDARYRAFVRGLEI